MTEKIHLDFIIPDTHAGRRLDQVIADLLPEYSRANIQSWIKSGQILVNEQAAKCKDKVKGLEKIQLNVELAIMDEAKPQDIPLAIQYEDDDIIVIDKPAGLVVHPGAGNPDLTLVNALLFHHPAAQLCPRAGIVHRLDKDTSGLMLIAKNIIAHNQLVQAIQERQIKRHYIAVVNGTFISGDTIDAPIGRHPRNRLKMAIGNHGKSAITHFKIRERFPTHTLLDIELETGRTHQIRCHMAYRQHPIIGDRIYGYRPMFPKNVDEDLKAALINFPRQALHAIKLSFTHPTTQENMSFEAKIPADIAELIGLLRQ